MKGTDSREDNQVANRTITWSAVSMRMLAGLALFGLGAGGCFGDRDDVGSLGRLPDADYDSVLVEIEAVRASTGQDPELSTGSVVEVAHFYDEYELDGNQLTFFLGTGSLSDLRWSIAYVHDRSTDLPVAGFPDEDSAYGLSLADTLDCLVAEHNVIDVDLPVLEALSLEALSSEATGQSKMDNCLRPD